jgi:hypothetical protein
VGREVGKVILERERERERDLVVDHVVEKVVFGRERFGCESCIRWRK